MLLNLIWILSVCCLAIAIPLSTDTDKQFKIRILHNNDIHGRFLETTANGEPCNEKLSSNNLCYGGFARTAHLIHEYRRQSDEPNARPVIYLNAGDTFTGTIWFSIFKHVITSELMNQLQPNATTFGNHEFDFGEKILTNYVKQSQFPFVVSNLDLTKSKRLSTASNLHKSIVLIVDGVRVGIVGYVTPDTMTQSSTHNIYIDSEIVAINEQIEVLKASDVQVIIALGHSGFEVDKIVAKKCPDIDIIIGGHTNTFLYNGSPPDTEVPDDVYPVVVENLDDGKKTLIVHAYAYTKYLGVLDVDFDTEGNVIDWAGNPILVNANIPQDAEILRIIENYRPNVTALSVVIGSTKNVINGKRTDCRRGECTFANLITNSILNARHRDLLSTNQTIDTFVAITTAGGIKGSLSHLNDGNITLLDIRTAFPYENLLYTVSVRGDILLQALEHSAAAYMAKEDGGFLHFTGMKVLYNMSKEIGHRVVDVQIKTSVNYDNMDNDDNRYDGHNFEPINTTKWYKIVMGKFVFKGGDGYNWNINENSTIESIKMNCSDYEALLKFIETNSPLNIEPDERITVIS